jgi:hypothetical protein
MRLPSAVTSSMTSTPEGSARALAGAPTPAGHLDDEPQTQCPGQPLEHLHRGGVLPQLQPCDLRLPHAHLLGKLRLRQAVLDAVTDDGECHRPGERRALPVCTEGRILPELFLPDLRGAT